MRWSVRIGRLAGTDIYIHITFVLLIVWVAAVAWQHEATVNSVFGQLAFLVALFACVLLHELGHATAARRYGISTRDITLLPFGGLARLERMPKEPVKELVIAVAGPLVNLLIAAGLIAVTGVLTASEGGLGAIADMSAPFLVRLAVVNVVLALFNLIPAFPMDGGRMLRAILGFRLGWFRATLAAAAVGQALAAVFVGFGILGNPILVIIGVFVLVAAHGEREMARTQEALAGLTVDKAMVSRFAAVTPDTPIEATAARLITGFQSDFPVLDPEGHALGVLTKADLINALPRGGRVDEAMRNVPTATSGSPLLLAWELMQRHESPVLLVTREDAVIGLVTLGQIGELVAVRRSLPSDPPTSVRPPRSVGAEVRS